MKTKRLETKLLTSFLFFCPIIRKIPFLKLSYPNYGRDCSTVYLWQLTKNSMSWYCLTPGYWMSDKPLVQQTLSSEFAELLLTISTTSASLSFLQAFWEATVREWNGIDRLRLERDSNSCLPSWCQLQIGQILHAHSKIHKCSIPTPHPGRLGGKGLYGVQCYPIFTRRTVVVSSLASYILYIDHFRSPDDSRVPSSLAYHLADIYLEELDKISYLPSVCP